MRLNMDACFPLKNYNHWADAHCRRLNGCTFDDLAHTFIPQIGIPLTSRAYQSLKQLPTPWRWPALRKTYLAEVWNATMPARFGHFHLTLLILQLLVLNLGIWFTKTAKIYMVITIAAPVHRIAIGTSRSIHEPLKGSLLQNAHGIGTNEG